MLPPGHVAIGYLAFSILRRTWYRDTPSDSSILWLLLGTQLPDLVDKPLAWGLGVLPSGRSLGHSLLFAIPLVVLVDRWLRGHEQSTASQAFAVGYFSHLLTDAADVLPVFRGGLEWGTFLVWPLLEPPDYGIEPSLWPPEKWSLSSLWPPLFYADPTALAVGLIVFGLWVSDGKPGLVYLYSVRNRLLVR